MKIVNYIAMLFFSMLILDTTSAQGNSQPITVYQHYDFKGKTQSFGEGYHPGYLAIGNDVISSVKVNKGWKVTLYEHGPKTGRALTLTSDAPNLGEYEFNDIISNVLVEKIPSGIYGIGDEHPCGGIVISVDESGKSGVIVAKKDVYEENIDKTTKAVQAMGKGWSVPNQKTMKMIAEHYSASDQLGLKKDWYWTSNRVSNGYWASLNVANGKSGNRFAGERQYCRPVMAFNSNTACKKPTAPAVEVAKGKMARQSSTKYAPNGAASFAVDGNKNGNWSWNNNSITHTKDEKDPWWEVDLGSVYDVSKIEIWNRRDCCWDRLQNFYLMVSENPISGNSTTQDQFVGGAHSFTSGDHPSMILEGNKRGRYVRIFLKGDGKPLSLTEVEVYGSPAN